MSNVTYIKQKAIEIANNSSHKIIIGIMNQKDVEADCSAIFLNAEDFSNLEEEPIFNLAAYYARREARIERRNKRNAERIARRSTY